MTGLSDTVVVTVAFGKSASVPGLVRVLTRSPVSAPPNMLVTPTNAVKSVVSGVTLLTRQYAIVAIHTVTFTAIATTTKVMMRRLVAGTVKFTYAASLVNRNPLRQRNSACAIDISSTASLSRSQLHACKLSSSNVFSKSKSFNLGHITSRFPLALGCEQVPQRSRCFGSCFPGLGLCQQILYRFPLNVCAFGRFISEVHSYVGAPRPAR